MPLGHTTRAITSPQGTVGRAATSIAGATGRDADNNFVPLSVFFLQMDGEGGTDGDTKRVTGYREKAMPGEDSKTQEKVRQKLGPIHWDDDENAMTRAMKGPRPKKPKPREEWSPAFGESMTTTANVPTMPRPIGRHVRRMDPKERKRWMERLAQQL